MTGRMRIGTALVAGLLGFVAQASAQIPGMPLFTNPRYGTGIRVHADLGQSTSSGTSIGANTVAEAGASIAIGSVGIVANVGTNFNRARQFASNQTYSINDNFTASALLQLRLMGGGINPLSLALFGGGSAEVTAKEIAIASQNFRSPKLMHFPVGAALGLHVPLGITSLNFWGAPRLVFSKFVSCPDADPTVTIGTVVYPLDPGASTRCAKTTQLFRWAAGVDMPILGILSIRAAYDSGNSAESSASGALQKVTRSFWGVGASIGIGGVR